MQPLSRVRCRSRARSIEEQYICHFGEEALLFSDGRGGLCLHTSLWYYEGQTSAPGASGGGTERLRQRRRVPSLRGSQKGSSVEEGRASRSKRRKPASLLCMGICVARWRQAVFWVQRQVIHSLIYSSAGCLFTEYLAWVWVEVRKQDRPVPLPHSA